jgi:hypothetical protein
MTHSSRLASTEAGQTMAKTATMVEWSSPDGIIICRLISDSQFHFVSVDIASEQVYSRAYDTLAEATQEAERLRGLFIGEVAH